MAMQMGDALSICPICGCLLQPAFNDNYEVLDESTDSLDCAMCGSLEGLDVERDVPKPKRTFSFRWSEGLVAPFIGARTSKIAAALEAADVSNGDHFFDLGCGETDAFSIIACSVTDTRIDCFMRTLLCFQAMEEL
jgi:hypothetical protein